MSFDKQSAKEARVELEKALKSYTEKTGNKVILGNINYSDKRFTVKLTVEKPGAIPEIEEGYNLYKDLYNLPEFGSIVSIKGSKGAYKIVGFKPRNTKYPVVIESIENGNRYKVAKNDIIQKEET